jgi:ATP-dependent DNA ligase
MEAKSVEKLPAGDVWQYEPKWDGFRCIAFRDGNKVELQSKSGQPLARYFPEVAEALLKLKAKQFVIDGEIVVPVEGKFSFDDLLMRIHPAASRIKKLSLETPAKLIVFDQLVDDRGKPLVDLTLEQRRHALSKRQSPRHGQSETPAHRRLRSWRVSLRVRGKGRRFFAARFV